jgi:hypothetical protein
MPDDLPQPLVSRAVLEPLTDGVRLTLGGRRRSVIPAVALLVCGVLGTAVGVVLLSLVVWHHEEALLGIACLLPATVGMALVGGVWLLLLTRGSLLEVTAGRLRVRVGGPLTGRRWEWARDALRAVASNGGLWIVTDDGVTLLFQVRDADEVAWFAAVLRRALEVPERIAPRPEELSVEYAAEPDEKYLPALLHVVPGKMSLREAVVPFSRYLFYPGEESLFQSWSPVPGVRQSVLADSDVTCRLWPNGAGSMRVRPGGTRLHLTIWARDGAAMTEALGRFRGGREDAERPEE